jgi:hypothetical protein
MELKITSQSPSPISFSAKKEPKDKLLAITQDIHRRPYSKTSLAGRTAQALTSQESSALGRLFRPVKTFIQKSLNLPLSQKELAKKIEEFALSPACKALGGPSLNTQQVHVLALEILKQESEGAPSLKNRAEIGGKSLELF